MNKKELIETFKNCKNDSELWKKVFELKNENFTIMLDNDDTFIDFGADSEDYVSFDEYIGNSYGIFILLEVLNINCENI